MAFDLQGLAQVSESFNTAPKMWAYKTDDSAGDIDSAGYFDDAADRLGVGDVIMAEHSGGTGLFRVNANDGTTVDVDNATDIGGTDSD
jgi:hypothetical protein